MQTDLFEGKFVNAQDAVKFMYAGRAVFTLVSVRTGIRYTYKIKTGTVNNKPTPVLFVHVLSGPDNTHSYSYIGYIKRDRLGELLSGNKGHGDALSFKALAWAMRKLSQGKIPQDLEIYHVGKCGACGRALTVPESIQTGLGPVCAGRHQ